MSEDMSKEDLLELLEELEKQLEEKDEEIAELTQAQTGRGKNRGGLSNREEIDVLESENEELREKSDNDAALISELREQLANSNVKATSLSEEKLELDKKIKAQNRRLDELEKEVVDITNKSRTATQQSRDFNSQKEANQREARRLFDENETLKEENKDLSTQLQQLEEEKEVMEEMIAKLADEKDEVAQKVEGVELEKDEVQSALVEMEKELEELQEKYQGSMNGEAALEIKAEALSLELKKSQEKAAKEAALQQAQIVELKAQVATLRDSTKLGEKQREIESLHAEKEESAKLIADLQSALEEAAAERDVLSERVLEMESSIDQRVADRVSAEKNRTRKLELAIESLKQQNQDNIEHFQSLEDEKLQLTKEVDELSNWKAVYEAGHGLQELARNQKKLKDDNRRLSTAVEQLTGKLGMVMDTNGLLTQAFDKLKKEAGKSDDFMYSEYDLQGEVQSFNASLKAQLVQLEEQVQSLELENMRLRSALKNHAALIGQQGFKYAGMSADQLVHVNEFAANLRDGKTELPLNDRSNELLKENKRLRDDLNAQKLTLERYELELGSAVGGNSFAAVGGSAESTSSGAGYETLQLNLQRVTEENKAMSLQMNSLHNSLNELLARQTSSAGTGPTIDTDAGAINQRNDVSVHSGAPVPGGGLISAAELSSILTQNNELVLNELEALRAEHQNLTSRQAAAATAPVAGYNDRFRMSLRGAMLLNAEAAQSSQAAKQMDRGQFTYSERTPNRYQSTPATATAAAGGMQRIAQQVPPIWTPSRSGRFSARLPQQEQPQLGPATPHGKQLLNNNLNQLNLPPEEWAVEVRDLNCQLVECLEKLYEREQELEDQNAALGNMEEQLVSIKQQMTALYFDYAQRADAWEAREQAMKREAAALLEQRDDLNVKLRRMQDMADLLQREDPQLVQLKITEVTRKVAILEVNEAVLSRKYIAQSEQLKQEQSSRLRLEQDFVEMESSLKKRILYLEQYKLAAGSRIGHLQAKIDCSVPQQEYLVLQSELEVLREDHLNTLRREVEARMSALREQDRGRELRSCKIVAAQLTADLEGARAGNNALGAELQHQKEATQKALAAVKSSAEVAQIVSEMARFRGEASRMEMELFASNRRAELLGERVQEVGAELDAANQRVRELEAREAELCVKDSESRKRALEMQLKYEGGLARDDAEKLRAQLHKVTQSFEESLRDVERHKELAEIASRQAQSMATFKKDNEDQLQELREFCTKLESRSEDELLIGRLQRQLMSTKTSYKAFVKKYQYAREHMRKRELGMRILEKRLDEQEKLVGQAQDSSRLEVSALKKALRNMRNTVFEDADGDQSSRSRSRSLLSRQHQQLASSLATVSSAAAASAAPDSLGNRKKSPLRAAGFASSGFTTMTLGNKLLDVSLKVDDLAQLATAAVERAANSEVACRELSGAVEDLTAEKHMLQQQAADLEALSRGKSKQQAIAARLIALSEDIRVSKISNLQQRRQIQLLRQEKRHLQAVISHIEADVMELEEGKVLAETKHILFDINENATAGTRPGEFSAQLLNFEDDSGGGSAATAEFGDRGVPLRPSLQLNAVTRDGSSSSSIGRHLSVNTGDLDAHLADDPHFPRGNADISAEELYQKLQQSHQQLADARRAMSAQTVKLGSLGNELADLQALLMERDGQVKYYERVIIEEGLPAVLLRRNTASAAHSDGDGQAMPDVRMNRQYKLLHEEQDRLQEAASATIGSLRGLLEEKNRVIERYREKLDRMQLSVGSHSRTRAERRADELLDRIAAEEDEEARVRKYTMFPSTAAAALQLGVGPIGLQAEAEKTHRALLDQMESADSIIAEKDRLVLQLEQKALAESNQRERAEVRCGDALREMEAMKADMITLVQQLQEAEARCTHLSKSSLRAATGTAGAVDVTGGAVVSSGRVRELEKLLRSKDEKVREYRDIIVKLKEEFIKAEEAKAVAEVRMKAREAADHSAAGGSGSSGISTEELRELKQRLSELHDGLRQAKEELEKARRVRERLTRERQEAEEAQRKSAEALQKAEQASSSAQNAYYRVRKDLEESRKKEVRMREKLKEFLSGEGGAGAGGAGRETLAKARERIEHLEREVDLLKAQNAALRKNDPASSSRLSAAADAGGQVLGAGSGAGVDDVRQQMHAKWEAEKKMQKRLNVLEKRLQEKVAENEELQSQVQRGRDTLHSALQSKEESQRRAATASRQAQASQQATAQELGEVEEAHGKVFAMEEEIVRLRRKAHVEQPNEISALSHQVSVQRARIAELEADLGEAESRRKQLAAAATGGGDRSLRASEDRFLRNEKLKDELDFARRQKLELEAALLDRDARAIEHKFDLEAAELETQRLRRRVRELEVAYSSLSAVAQQPGATTRTATGAAGAGSSSTGRSKEQELEGVVEAMKRVVDKLKTENDRLKRGDSGDKRSLDAERRLQTERKKCESLQEEIRMLNGKLKGHEESSQRVVQRQQQVAQLRRQLKAKEDEGGEQRAQLEKVLVEREALKSRSVQLQDRVNQLEIAQHQQQRDQSNNNSNSSQQQQQQQQQQQGEILALRDEVSELRRQLRTNSSSSSGAAPTAEMRRLRDENQKLKAELSAFDLDFFEEIENLKFAHAEAVRKLRAYEQSRS